MTKTKKPITRTLFIIFATIVPIVNFLIFYVYVNFSSFIMGFQTIVGGKVKFGFDNFIRFFNEFSNPTSEIVLSLKNTLLTFLILQIMFPISMLVSFFLYKKILFSSVFRYILFLPGLIAPTVVSSFFIRIVSVDGPIAPLIQNLFNLEYMPTLLTDSDFANKMVLLQLIWLSIPGNLVLWSGAFSKIPEAMIEAAQLDGVTWYQEIFYIILPAIWPTFSMLWLLSFSTIFGSTGQVFLLTKGEAETITLNCWMYLQVYNNKAGVHYSGTYNYLSAVGLIITVVSMVITIIVRKLTGQSKGAEVEY